MKVHTWEQDSMGHVCQGDIGQVLWDYKCLIVHFQYSVKQDSIKDIFTSQGQNSGLKINNLLYTKGNFFFPEIKMHCYIVQLFSARVLLK